MLEKTRPLLITGGTGFAGYHLTEHCCELGFTQLHLTGLSAQAPEWVSTFPGVAYHSVDLTQPEATQQLIQLTQPEAVVHLASIAAVQSSFDQAATVLRANQEIQLAVLEAVRLHAPHARVLAISSAEVYGTSEPHELPITTDHPLRPLSPYGISKVTQDLLSSYYHRFYGLNIVRLRPFNHIGERQTAAFAVPAFAQQIVAIERGKQSNLQVGNLSAVRDFTDVKDMVRAYVLLLEKGTAGEVYNVGSGVGVSMESVVELLRSHATAAVPLVTDPARVRALDVPVSIAEASAVRALGWQPEIPLSSTLQRVLEWQRTQG